jgi:hypothetical protein
LEEAAQPGDASGHRDLLEGRIWPVYESATILSVRTAAFVTFGLEGASE